MRSSRCCWRAALLAAALEQPSICVVLEWLRPGERMGGGEHEERQPDATSAGLLLDLLYCKRQSQSPSDVTPNSDTDTAAGHQIKARAATPELAAAKAASGTTAAVASTQVRDELAGRWNEEAEADGSEGAEDTPGSSDLCPLCMRPCEEHHRCGLVAPLQLPASLFAHAGPPRTLTHAGARHCRLGKFWQKFGYSGPP